MKRYLIVVLLFLSLADILSVLAQDNPFRSVEQMARLLEGSWIAKDFVYEPGAPFFGTKEQKAEVDSRMKTMVDLYMPKMQLELQKGGKMLYSVVAQNEKPKLHKGRWRLEQDGDILILEFGKNERDTLKLLHVDENEIESFIDDGSSRMIVVWTRK